MRRRSWSSAKKVNYKGIKFDSVAEKDYYVILLDLKKKGLIKDIELQRRFSIPDMNGGKRFHYTVDFVVTDSKDNEHCVEVKGRFMPGNKMRYAYWQQLYRKTLHIVPTTGVAKLNTDWLTCTKCTGSLSESPVIDIFKP